MVGNHFNVITRGTGTLCNTSDRRCLRSVTITFRNVDDPVTQYSTTLTTHCKDRQLDDIGYSVHLFIMLAQIPGPDGTGGAGGFRSDRG